MLDELGDDALEDVGVPLHEGQSRLPLLLPGSCRHDANPGAGCDGVVGAGVNFHVPGASQQDPIKVKNILLYN